MTKDEVIKELASLVRQSEDAARSNDAGAAAFHDEYESLCTVIDQVNHDRISEIYEYVVGWPRNAKRLRKEAEVFKAAIRLLGASLPG
jgi:hypothetical protein